MGIAYHWDLSIFVQFSIRRLGTCLKCFSLLVISTASADRAQAAIKMSIFPIGVPFSSRMFRIFA